MSYLAHFTRKRLEDGILSALRPVGMSAHTGKGSFYVHDVNRALVVVGMLEREKMNLERELALALDRERRLKHEVAELMLQLQGKTK